MEQLKYLFAIAVFFILLFSSCSNEVVPTPSISFDSNPFALKHAESNRFLDSEICIETHKAEALSSRYNFKYYNYLSSSNDTIQYFFVKDKVFHVLVKCDETKSLSSLTKKVEELLLPKKLEDGFYETENLYFRIGKDSKTNKCYILYYKSEKRIKDAIQFLLQDDNTPGHDAGKRGKGLLTQSGDAISIQAFLYLTGHVTGECVLFGKIPSDHYGSIIYDQDLVEKEAKRIRSILGL